MSVELTPIQVHLLKRMIRREFDECEWYMADEVVELATALGFDELAAEMEVDHQYEKIQETVKIK